MLQTFTFFPAFLALSLLQEGFEWQAKEIYNIIIPLPLENIADAEELYQ